MADVLPYSLMFSKILLTLAVILGTYYVIRTRMQYDRKPATNPPLRPSLVPPGILKGIAYGLVVAMVMGSLLWLYLGYQSGREIVTVRIINANTGNVTTYQARRVDVQDQRFTTLDGRPIILADVDRMELSAER